MLRAQEPRVAVLLEQQFVDVVGGRVERVAVGIRHPRLSLLHGLAVYVDLTRCAGAQKFSAENISAKVLTAYFSYTNCTKYAMMQEIK